MSSRMFARAVGSGISRRSNNTTAKFIPSLKSPLRHTIRQNNTRNLRFASINELISTRLNAAIRGAETSIPQGWDDGIDDDDGG